MTYVYDFDDRHGLPPQDLARLIGGKAANLTVMATELGLPVPPGFTITTTACMAYLAHGWPAGLDEEIRAHMARIEAAVGRRFGDPSDPLLVSVRSGAPVSMPGMMDTILNLGLNKATAGGLGVAAEDPDFAADCHRRFREMYRDVVGDGVPDDPWQQLRGAVEAVFRSWNSDRARAYRRFEAIPDDLGTAVTVQAMVFGNRGGDSGTGVLFTRNPSTGEPTLYGDLMFDAQGEDVVAGTHRTEPISALDVRMPAVADELRRYAGVLERHYRDLCDIEFTIERGRLWMLQVRIGKRSPQAALRMAIDMAESGDFPFTRAEAVERVAPLLLDPPTATTERLEAGPALATGLPASPGIASGRIEVTADAAASAGEAGQSVILVRQETSPDDVHGMAKAAGVLTATGGFASHAAVVARGWGIPAVVGASAVSVDEGGVTIGERRLGVGDLITIDGGTGEIFAGAVAGTRSVVPEAATLLAWARELGIAIGDASAARREAGREPAAAGPIAEPTAEAGAGPAATPAPPATTAEIVVRALGVKGFATPESLAEAMRSTPEEMSTWLDRLVADGLAELAAGSFRLTVDGKALCREAIEADRLRWGAANAEAALDAFHPFDLRMKDIVTAWQVRGSGADAPVNDHSDADYDAGVLERLAGLHDDAARWLGGLAVACPALLAYGPRLERALAQARGGDPRFVASPRVDSYHGVWFELHEELIRLAGRRRSEEVAAGRA